MAEAIDPKYIFDPENPRSSPIYTLLRTIIKDSNHLAFIDLAFLSEIYHKQIFSAEIEAEFWDKPSDFNELSGMKKAALYADNYSISDYIKRLELIELYSPIFTSLFQETITFKSIDNQSLIVNSNVSDIEQLSDLSGLQKRDESHCLVMHPPQLNYVFFITRQMPQILAILQSIAFQVLRTSIVIILMEDYLEDELFRMYFKRYPHQKPVILKRSQDIHALFDVLDLDINGKKSAITVSAFQEIRSADSFSIKNYFSIHNIHLENLGKYREIYFLGENGDGKTILLQSMILALKGKQQDGFVVELLKENPHEEALCEATDSAGRQYGYNDETAGEPHPIVLGYGSGRFRNDAGLANETGYESLFDHKHEVYLHSPEQWLKDLRLNELSKNGTHPAISSEKAIHLLQKLLHDNVVIEIIGSEVDFIERGTRLKFKQLSDGYKSVLVWLCDMLARLTKAQPEVEELEYLQGIVLVDEIGLYLHPKWQYQLVRQLRDWFPKVQFIFTTHSPMIILGASRDAIFFRVYKEDGVTQVSEPVEMSSIANQMANSLITAPFLFNMETARPAAFDPTTEHLETADDYISGQIDQEIARRVQEQHHSSPEAIAAIIAQELDAFERKQKEGAAQ
jgi:hypothetical protein